MGLAEVMEFKALRWGHFRALSWQAHKIMEHGDQRRGTVRDT